MAAKTDAALTVSDWKDRIRPHLNASMQDVSDAITNAAPIQSWLHKASFEAAEGLAQMHAMQAEAMGHMRMLNDLEDSFPALCEAVDELTHGFGSLDIHWRPLTPNFSRIRITFDRDYSVGSFLTLEEPRPQAAQSLLETLRSTLPKGDPFPNRPHKVTGLVVYEEVPLGVRLHDRLADEGRTVTVTLFPDGAKAVEDLPFMVAPRAIADYFTAETSSS
ncbi:hypothetical protein CRI94_02865 [Longibacter salinarum]|uniref:Uncharacterized protein n=1 Tax=Longibacter salinarum TaxID=1850348 RepID=A0A2A8D344_9BACT|nr:hypothetical protein [Longibacter salinarum]PEN15237.1 hypothetical protein CRI94_02865 [Longibacter salinarum]